MPQQESWITTVESVRAFRDQLDAEGKKLVFTNGCFDLLHAGHVRYLRQARQLGDGLVVALNSDASVSLLKGPSRPVNTQDDRAEILMALQSVNGVVVFEETRVTRLIEIIQPHVYAKGGDYTMETLNGEERTALERAGTTIVLLPRLGGRSTSAALERMRLAETRPASAAAAPARPAAASRPLAAPRPAPARGDSFGVVVDRPAAVARSSTPVSATPPSNGTTRIRVRTSREPAPAPAPVRSRAPIEDDDNPSWFADTEPPLRLGIVGSGQGTNFEAIQRAIEDGTLHAEISVVISDVEGSRLLTKAREAGLAAVYVDAGDNNKVLPRQAQEEIYEQLLAHQVQVVVLTGFMRVIKEPLLSGYRDRIVNIHPSLLPKFKGRAAWVQALEEGEVETGCTVHLVNADIDAGRILAQARVPINIGDTADDVFYRIQAEEHKLLPRVLHEWRDLGLEVG